MIIITGFARSGTTALGECLGGSRDACYLGEVFHPGGATESQKLAQLRLKNPENFWHFKSSLDVARLRKLPDLQTQQALWRDYVSNLTNLNQGLRLILDIKYNSWHHFDTVWHAAGERPDLFRFISQARNLRILHCIRRDRFSQAMSGLVSAALGIWHSTADAACALSGPSIKIPSTAVIKRMEDSRRQTELFQFWLKDLPAIEVIYEDAFDETGSLTPYCVQMLSEHLDLTIKTTTSSMRPLKRDYRSIVLNFDELLSEIRTADQRQLVSR